MNGAGETKPTANRNDERASHGLSKLQQSLVTAIRSYEVETEFEAWPEFARVWGVRWSVIRASNPTRAESASLSRAIRRLETRGLVERRNDIRGDAYVKADSVDTDGTRWITDVDLNGHPFRQALPQRYRLTHIRLTDLGRRVADELLDSRNG